ncbi:hypothetical protein BHU72_11810 [Desulfuribacillus stibiiarsenatis]|uniref:HTH cro/C1-type domain-containing protein n=1 Tax=Desulfuribacillus stibiiarsenatis TaxID=1390249 RepID=A0A1E5L7U5_9FIRM|nr:helix-turn-helix transcriptional regulator [Desulfuribacillus stibiiarsenatis]OEH86215.1 hypothetical protein BHU72_11810 [Desulfuribacillus stibiiarsenatis]
MLGQRLRGLRKLKKMTQQDIADKMSLAKSTISQYENNINEPDNEMINKLADFFEVTVDYLLGRTDNPSPADTDDWGLPEDAHVFFKDYEKLSDEDKVKAREHIKFLLHMAEQKNNENGQK